MRDPDVTLSAELERAVADYLAVSRGRHLYASADEHATAEDRCWTRLEAAIAADRGDAERAPAVPAG